MEDDLEISPALPAILSRLQDLPSDWQILRLSNAPKRHVVKAVSRDTASFDTPLLRITLGLSDISSGAQRFLNWRVQRVDAVTSTSTMSGCTE